MKNPYSHVVSSPDFESWSPGFESSWRWNSVHDCHLVIILIIHYLNNRLNMTLMGWLGRKASTQSNDLNSVEKDIIQQIITIMYASCMHFFLPGCWPSVLSILISGVNCWKVSQVTWSIIHRFPLKHLSQLQQTTFWFFIDFFLFFRVNETWHFMWIVS